MKPISFLLAIVLVLSVFTACGNSVLSEESQSTEPLPPTATICGAQNEYKIACLLAQTTGNFWGVAAAGANAAIAELKSAGHESYIVTLESSDDFESQKRQIDAALNKDKVDGIILQPAHVTQILNHINDTFTEKTNCPIVLILPEYEEVPASPWISTVYSYDYYGMGQDCGKLAEEVLSQGGYVVPIADDDTILLDKILVEGTMDWLEMGSNTIQTVKSEQTDTNGIYWVARNQPNTLEAFVEDVCNTYQGDTVVFVAMSKSNVEELVNAVAKCVRTRDGVQMKVIACNPPQSYFTDSGELYRVPDVCYGFVLKNPYRLGYDAAFTLLDILEEEQVAPIICVPHTKVDERMWEKEEIEYLPHMYCPNL